MKEILIGAIIVGVLISGIVAEQTHESQYSVTVTDKQVKRSGDHDKYLVYTKLDNGSTRVFENTDTLWRFKYDSSDMYGQIAVGKHYNFKTYGFRIPFLSMYENVYEVSQ